MTPDPRIRMLTIIVALLCAITGLTAGAVVWLLRHPRTVILAPTSAIPSYYTDNPEVSL